MKRTLILVTIWGCTAAFSGIARSAEQTVKPLSQSQLLNTIDSLGTGDPTRKVPLSLLAEAGTSEARKPEQKGAEKSEKELKGATEITARQASFDQKTNQAVFAGDVIVKNPEFDITCEKLTAFMRGNVTKGGSGSASSAQATTPAAAAPTAPAAGKAADKKTSTGGMEKVIAEGSVVITQEKTDAEGKLNRNIGRARRAVYDAATGDVTLTGRPEVQQGINTIVATDDSTVITLNREGRMTVNGPSKSVINEAPESPTGNAR